MGTAPAETDSRDKTNEIFILICPKTVGIAQLFGLKLTQVLKHVHLWFYPPGLLAVRFSFVMQRFETNATNAVLPLL